MTTTLTPGQTVHIDGDAPNETATVVEVLGRFVRCQYPNGGIYDAETDHVEVV